MSSKTPDQKRARAIQKHTGWSYSECLRLVRDRISDKALAALVAIRSTVHKSVEKPDGE